MSDDRAQILVISESDEPELIVSKVSGSITREAFSDVENPEDALGSPAFSKKLLLNLSECVHLDSTGISWLLQLHRRCHNANGQLVIHSVPPALWRIMEMLNIQTVLHIVDDEQAARSFICAAAESHRQ